MSRAALAAAGGALLAAAFPGPGVAALAWVALVPVIILPITASRPLRAAGEGLLFVATFHILTFSWWYGLLRNFGRLSNPEASAVYILMAVYVALYGAAFAAALALIARRRGAGAAIMAAPFLWTALEALRGVAFTGLPWSVLGASQQPWTAAIQVADIGGVEAVTLVVACGNALVAWLILPKAAGLLGVPMARPRGAWALALVPVAALAYGAARMGADWGGDRTVRVGVIQGNVPQDVKWEASARMKILHDHLDATSEAAGRGAEVVVWPESSVPLAITSTPAYRLMLEGRAVELGIELIVGSVHYARGADRTAVYNSAFLFDGGAPGTEPQRYDKIHLVPFGEYVPLSSWLGPVERMVEEASDFSPGGAPALFDARGGRLGPFICFEAIFPGLVRRIAASGAQVLVNLTNDAMLGDTAGPRQHLALAALRAVETRRWMVRAANTGISAVVDPAGRIVASAPYATRAVLVEDVPLLDSVTPYMAWGDLLSWGCGIIAVLLLVIPSTQGHRRT